MKTGPGQEVGVESLEAFFARAPRFAVAFSGGCDSSYLVSAAMRAGCDVKAYLVRTAFQLPCEIQDAQRLADGCGVDFAIIDVDVLENEGICANPPDRCYLCKTFIFSTIMAHMKADGFDVLVDGTNVTDNPERRPGFRALAELGVVSPLRRAGMEKDDVRAASRELGLFTADKPSFSCLATHVPENERITAEALHAVAASSEVVARIVARNAAVGASLNAECNPAFLASDDDALRGEDERSSIEHELLSSFQPSTFGGFETAGER